MKLIRYKSLGLFRQDVLPVLLEDEVHNNLLVGLISGTATANTADWFMATVCDDIGDISLVALCTRPFNMLLYAPKDAAASLAHIAVSLLAESLHTAAFEPPGVFAKSELAQQFAMASGWNISGLKRMPLMLMKLEKLLPYKRAPGSCRVLTENDIRFVTLWEEAFSVDCRIPVFSLDDIRKRILTRLGKDIHYIWEDEDRLPVSQAVFGRETPNGAVVNWVYTPPQFRGRGFATAVVAELTKSLLARGKKFCCLFADANNKTSRGLYSKLGYRDVCLLEEIRLC